MLYSFFEEDVWCYWLVSIGTLLSFVGFLIACICSCRHNDKSEFLGLPGMVTIAHPDGEGFNGLPSNDISQVITRDITDGGKRASTANRSLPDIPKDKSIESEHTTESIPRNVIYEATEMLSDPSELYATVHDKGEEKNSERDKPSISQQSSQDDTVNLYARLANPRVDNDEHPYAQVQNVQKTEINPRVRNNSSQIIDNAEPSISLNQMGENPIAPPRTRRTSSHTSLLSTEPLADIQAANAISGGVQANQDLPYMTPPMLISFPHSPPSQQNNPNQHFSGDSQDSKGYTSISVREPLANIIAQTKETHQQRQAVRSLTDPHYATVSDDSDEMYAAIDEQDKVYTSGSETYAQIQPMAIEMNRIIQSEQQSCRQISRTEDYVSAPQPPSVDSLRYVAHAHSRQASSSSATSSIINPSSPKPEKRQANSPLPPPPEGLGDVYSSVEKRCKTEDRMRSNAVSSGKSLEDMYAKVMKKKKDNDETLHETTVFNFDVPLPKRKLSLVETNRTAWSTHDSTETQKREMDVVYHADIEVTVDTNSSSVTVDHGYEALTSTSRKSVSAQQSTSGDDPNYETLQEGVQYLRGPTGNRYQNTPERLGNGADDLALYSVPFKHRQASNASSDDPGYERVRARKGTDLDHDMDSEPNYESMPHDSGEPNYASVCRPGDSDHDPNYESVGHSDPNYESVKYMSMTSPREDPPYEQVNNYKLDGYEKVKSHDEQKDPDYEKIDPNYSSLQETTVNRDTDDEQYVQV